jgi:hypothetical protein
VTLKGHIHGHVLQIAKTENLAKDVFTMHMYRDIHTIAAFSIIYQTYYVNVRQVSDMFSQEENKTRK